MANQSVALFLQACGAAGPLRVGVEHPAGWETLRREFEQPFLVVGREAGADLPLADPAVSRRHAYLQVIAGHVFCLDLRSRTGVLWDGQSRRSGWLQPDRAVGIGPFAVRLLGGGSGGPPPDAWDPLAALPPEQDPLPPASLEVRSGTRMTPWWRMDRTLAVVGRGQSGAVQVGGRSVLHPYCALLRTPLGLWVVDLLAPGGVSVNGAPGVRWARLEDGDELLVGGVLLGVRCHTEPTLAPPPPPPAAAPRPDGAAAGEAERLRAQHQAAAAEAEQLRGQVTVLERSLAEASAARDQLAQDGQQAAARWEAERLALREQWEREQQAWAEERGDLRGEVERLGQEAAALRLEGERLAAELEAARAEAADARRQSAQDGIDLRGEAERLREDNERLAAALERAQAEADQGRALREELDGRQGQEAEALRAELEVARAEAADARRRSDQELADLRGEAERLRQESEALRLEGERLTAELTGAQAEAAQAQATRGELDAARAWAAEARRQWQEQLDTARRQSDQELADLRREVERLRQEAALLRREREAAPRPVPPMPVFTVTTTAASATPAPPAPPAVARPDEPTGLDAVFIALGREASSRPGGAGPARGRGTPPARP